jgi:putative transcriptional regulator
MPLISIEDAPNLNAEQRARLKSTSEAEVAGYIAEDGDVDLGTVEPARLRARSAYPDPRALRTRLKMTQEEFATTFGVNLWTLREWEQRKAEPEGPARTLLRVIDREPDAVRRALLP